LGCSSEPHRLHHSAIDPPDIEPLLCDPAARRAHLLDPLRLQDEPLHRIRQGADIAGRHQESVNAVDHGLAASRGVGGDHRASHRHSLLGAAGHALSVRGQHEDARLSEPGADVGDVARPFEHAL